MMLQTGRAARNNTSSLNRCCYPRSSLILYSCNSTERSWTLSPSLNSLWHCLYVQSTAQFMKMQFISCRMLSGAGRMQTEKRACGGCWIWVLALLLFFFNVSDKKSLLFFSLLPAQQQLLSFATESVLHQAISLLWRCCFTWSRCPLQLQHLPIPVGSICTCQLLSRP